MPVSRQDVLHIAALAQLELQEGEIEGLIIDLGRILEHMATLDELDTRGVSPSSLLGVDSAPLREDRSLPCLSAEQALAEAPRTASGGFAVPAFVDEA